MMPAAPSPLAVAQAMQQGDSSASNRPFVIPVRETSVHAPPPAMPMQSPPTSSSFGRQPTAHYPSPAPQASGYYPNPTTSTSNSWPRHQHTPAHHHAPQHVFGVPDEFQHHPYYARSPPQHVRQVPPPPPSGANVFPPPRTTPVHASPGAGPGQPYAYPNTAAGGGGGYARQPVMLPGVPDPPVLPPVLPHQQQHIGVGARPSVVVQRSAHQQQQQQQPYSGGAYYGGQGHGQGGGGGYR
ncbi:hypothetical protein BCR44DRAFT_35142 [Catenaria anguillulae PL171]|uniref:Uncharacterized protein n=1 Tax=Catenaria anguillulae PL171 TaxID=765915 RepID=A0A1Y2H7B2_9FUNG|nr:hypothetical protein BCR44DRAFT_35142 [Catenaria anguillulae PL171]